MSLPSPDTETIPRTVWCVERTGDPCGVVIFGASGDLTERKLVPALFTLYRQRLLARRFFVVGFGRSPLPDEAFRAKMVKAIRALSSGDTASEDTSPEKFLARFHYISGDYADPRSYESLEATLRRLEALHGTSGNHLFYLATPPTLYPVILGHLGKLSLARDGPSSRSWARIIIEKPFGRDLSSARALNREISQHFAERQIYRMDHYLGKETVQNILIFRFANTIFEPLWNQRYVNHVQLTAAETLGVEHRAGYYEQSGCLRDMFQNHMLQLLCLTAMEPPATFDADRVRDETVKVLHALRPVPTEEVSACVIPGQYAPGAMPSGERVPGYAEEEGVNPRSRTETFVAAKFFIDNWRWQGVPFYLRAGKRLPRRATEVVVRFRRVPHFLFHPTSREEVSPNKLIIRIQPDEGITLTFEAKSPGPKIALATVPMEFSYAESFKALSPEAYERLFLDCMLGDQTLFAREDWLDLSWAFITPILERWEELRTAPRSYPAGSWGPKEADELLERDGQSWHHP